METTVDTQILQALAKIPEPMKPEVLDYLNALIEKKATASSEEEQPKKRRIGILKGTFVLPLPDDFDDPLEDFEEYM